MKMNTELKEALASRVETINEELSNLGENIQVMIKEVPKNGTMKIGLACVSDEYNCNPTIYPDEAFLEKDDDELAHEISAFYRQNAQNFDAMKIMQRSYIEENVIPRIESEKNMMFLKREGFACRSYLDFVITYAVVLDNFMKDGMASVKLTTDILEKAGISMDEIHEMAIRNMEKDIQVDSLWNILSGMMGGFPVPMEEASGPKMWVMSNSSKHYGAAALLSKSKLQDLSEELGGDLVILPSSINELIVLKVDDAYDMDMMLQMVKDVNSTTVSAEEKLTDNCYIFSDGDLRSFV